MGVMEFSVCINIDAHEKGGVEGNIVNIEKSVLWIPLIRISVIKGVPPADSPERVIKREQKSPVEVFVVFFFFFLLHERDLLLLFARFVLRRR